MEEEKVAAIDTETVPQKKVYGELEQSIINRMDEAAKEDRDRFFAVADTLGFQPKYKDRLGDIEEVKQEWRDMTALPGYPEIDWPLTLPDWFPVIKFASRWDTSYLARTAETYRSFASAPGLPGVGEPPTEQ